MVIQRAKDADSRWEGRTLCKGVVDWGGGGVDSNDRD